MGCRHSNSYRARIELGVLARLGKRYVSAQRLRPAIRTAAVNQAPATSESTSPKLRFRSPAIHKRHASGSDESPTNETPCNPHNPVITVVPKQTQAKIIRTTVTDRSCKRHHAPSRTARRTLHRGFRTTAGSNRFDRVEATACRRTRKLCRRDAPRPSSEALCLVCELSGQIWPDTPVDGSPCSVGPS